MGVRDVTTTVLGMLLRVSYSHIHDLLSSGVTVVSWYSFSLIPRLLPDLGMRLRPLLKG